MIFRELWSSKVGRKFAKLLLAAVVVVRNVVSKKIEKLHIQARVSINRNLFIIDNDHYCCITLCVKREVKTWT